MSSCRTFPLPDVKDPLTNIVAGLDYIQRRYGEVSMPALRDAYYGYPEEIYPEDAPAMPTYVPVYSSGLKLAKGSITSTVDERVGFTRSWPATIGFVRVGGRARGLTLRWRNRTVWAALFRGERVTKRYKRITTVRAERQPYLPTRPDLAMHDQEN